MKQAEDTDPQILGGDKRRQQKEDESGWEKAYTN